MLETQVEVSVRQRLMDSAVLLFTTRGYAATSVREIVEMAGVTKPALYYHFESKEGIYLAILDELVKIARLAKKHGFWLLYDDTYAHLVFRPGGPPSLREVKEAAGGVVGQQQHAYGPGRFRHQALQDLHRYILGQAGDIVVAQQGLHLLFRFAQVDIGAEFGQVGLAGQVPEISLYLLGDHVFYGFRYHVRLREGAGSPDAGRLAALLRRPIVLMFGIYLGGNRYEVHYEPLPLEGSDVQRLAARYAERLAYHARRAPYNWFNFYDFWK